MEELQLFAKFMRSGHIGSGESSAIVCALHGQHKLAMESTRAIKEAKRAAPGIHLLKTQAVMVSLISEGLLDVSEADEIKRVWELKHRFRSQGRS